VNDVGVFFEGAWFGYAPNTAAGQHTTSTYRVTVADRQLQINIADFTGDGELFMLRVRGESMIEAGILDGDFIVARVETQARNGDVVVAGIPGEEATVKTFFKDGQKVTLRPANSTMEDLVYAANEVQIFGKVVTVLRKY
jgi:SOS regulatory protein LexA